MATSPQPVLYHPMLVVHGDHDMLIHPAAVRAFVQRVRAVSSHPVIYAELPGAHHDFDMFESIRSAAVSFASSGKCAVTLSIAFSSFD